MQHSTVQCKCSLSIAAFRCAGAGIWALWAYFQTTSTYMIGVVNCSYSYKPAVRQPDMQLLTADTALCLKLARHHLSSFKAPDFISKKVSS